MAAPPPAPSSVASAPPPTHAQPCACTHSRADDAAASSPLSSSSPSPSPSPLAFEVFELFAGLGGFRLSLPAGLRVHQLTSVEIDQRAAEAYRRNWHEGQREGSTHAQAQESDTDGREEQQARRKGDRQGATAAGPAAAAAGAAASTDVSAMSVRARIKHNRKLFFAEQQRKKQEQEAAGQADSDAAAGGADTVAAVPAPPVPPTPVTSAVAQAASDAAAAVPPADGGAPRLLVASTTLAAFDLPPPVYDRSSVVQPCLPSRLLVRLLEQLPPSALVSSAPSLHPSIWLMSPPCQPFTRTKHSKQLDSRDMRNAAFMYILRTLRELDHSLRPMHLFLENVKHFFGSDMHAQLMTTLRECGYSFSQYLLSPMQLGIPNHRTRFYLAAKRHHALSDPEYVQRTEHEWQRMQAELVLVPPGCSVMAQQSVGVGEDGEEAAGVDATPSAASAPDSRPAHAAGVTPASDESAPAPFVLPKSATLPCVVAPSPLLPFLDPPSSLPPAALAALLLPVHLLSKGFHLSVVSPYDRRTFCFTGGYGKVVHTSSGSFLMHRGKQVDEQQALTEHPLDKGAAGLQAYHGSLRFFSPAELLRLFGFPAWFRFPARFTCRHAYKLIGNSVNVRVLGTILQHHLAEYTHGDGMREKRSGKEAEGQAGDHAPEEKCPS